MRASFPFALALDLEATSRVLPSSTPQSLQVKNTMRSVALLLLATGLVIGQTTGVPGSYDLVINGQGSGGTSCIPISAVASLTMDITGPANAPIIVAQSGSCVLGQNIGAVNTTLDISPMTIQILLDGTGILLPNGPFNGFSLLGPGGAWSLGISLNLPAGPLGFFQAAVIDPSFAGGFELTQAFDVTIPPTQCFPGPLPGPSTDDSSLQYTFLGGPFTFYGTAYPDCWVNENGSVGFGTGNADFSASEMEFLAQEPRIAPLWSDLDITHNPQGSITMSETTGLFTVTYFRQGFYYSTDPLDENTYCTTLDLLSGTITQSWDLCQRDGGILNLILTGITPGMNLSAPNNVDISSAATTPILTTGATDAIYEDFVLGAYGTLFDLEYTTRTYLPSGLGTGPYVLF